MPRPLGRDTPEGIRAQQRAQQLFAQRQAQQQAQARASQTPMQQALGSMFSPAMAAQFQQAQAQQQAPVQSPFMRAALDAQQATPPSTPSRSTPVIRPSEGQAFLQNHMLSRMFSPDIVAQIQQQLPAQQPSSNVTSTMMGGGGGGAPNLQPGQEVTVQGAGGPPAIDEIKKRLIEASYGLSRQPYQAYPGTRVAGSNPTLDRALQLSSQEGISNPYFSRANQSLEQAAQDFPSQHQDYMNPYMQQVIDRIRTEGMRNYNEGILPALESQFVGLGQHGSTRHQELASRAARDTQQEIAAQQAKSLAGGYQQGAQIYANDAARRAGIGEQYGELGRLRQGVHLGDITALEGAGERERQHQQQILNVGHENFMRANEYPRQALGQHANIINQVPFSSQQISTRYTPQPMQLNTMGQIGNLATAALGARQMMQRKTGGYINPKTKGSKLGTMSLTQSSFGKSPKTGGRHSLMHRK